MRFLKESDKNAKKRENQKFMNFQLIVFEPQNYLSKTIKIFKILNSF